jgi:hypothetical protein
LLSPLVAAIITTRASRLQSLRDPVPLTSFDPRSLTLHTYSRKLTASHARMTNMRSVSQSAKTAHENAPPISLAPLKIELGDQAHLLQYLPYNKAEFSDQQEDPDAVPLKLHYGTLKTSNDDHVFIIAYPAVNAISSPGFSIFTCDSAGNLKERIPALDIGSWATPDAAFDGLVHQQKVLAVAKYYFMMRGVDMKYPVPISKTFKEAILAACTVMKKGKDEAAASIVPLTSNYRMVKSEQPRLFTGSTIPSKPHELIMVARHKAPREERLGLDGEIEKAGVDTAKAQSMVVKLHVGPGPRKNGAGKKCAAEKRLPTMHTLNSSLDDLHGSSHALNGSSDAFSESSDTTIDGSTRAPTHEKTPEPNAQTVVPEKQMPDNPISLPCIAPDLLHREHISNTRTVSFPPSS